MKTISILLGALFAMTFAHAQEISNKEVPTVVTNTLQKNYPSAEKLRWEVEKGNYEAEFEVNETGYSLLIDISGNILETEMEIKVAELPVKAKDFVSKNYAGKKIKEATKITDSKGDVTYEAEVKGKDLIFDSDGNLNREIK